MKKTLVAIFSLCSASFAHAELGSYTVSSTTTKLQTDTIAGWSMDLNDGCYSVTGSASTLPTQVELASVAIQGSTDASSLKLAVYVHPGDGQHIGYWGDKVDNQSLFHTDALVGLSSAATGSNGTWTFNFDSLRLNSEQIYFFLFVNTAADASTVDSWAGYVANKGTYDTDVFDSASQHTDGNDFAEGVWAYISGNNNEHYDAGDGYTDALLMNTRSRSPIVSYSVKDGSAAAAIPEPATATLSLLALAGLAARRRRR